MALISLLYFFLEVETFSWNRGSSALARGPPSDIIDGMNRGGDNENGIRLLSKSECTSTVSKWFRKLGLVSGSQSIDRLNALLELENFSNIMPGIKPRREELIAFGEFIDGNVECLATVRWHKNTFPAEMEVLNILAGPKSNRGDKELGLSMTNFICEMCRENSIFPNFTSLENLSHLRKLNFRESLRKFGWSNEEDLESLSTAGKLVYVNVGKNLNDVVVCNMYLSVNKSPVVCLDGLTKEVDLGHFWYETKVRHMKNSDLVVPLYFRRKKYNEYEISFTRPRTGINNGSGTVGGALVLPVDSNMLGKAIPVRKEMVKRVVEAIKSKINHPSLD